MVGRAAQKLFPIQFGLVHLVRHHPAFARRIILVPIGMNESNFAHLAGINDFLPLNIVVPTSLLHTGLHDAFGFFDGLYHLLAFFDGMHDGLFAIDILAGFNGVHQHLFVPMVGTGDEHRVDVLPVEEVTVVEVGGGGRSCRLECGFAVCPVDIANRRHFNRGVFHEQRHIVLPALARAQQRQTDSFIGAQHARGGETAQCRRPCTRQSGVLQEVPSRNCIMTTLLWHYCPPGERLL